MLAEAVLESVACPLCQSPRSRTWFVGPDRHQSHEPVFGVKVCLACGFRFTSPRPTLEAMATFYPPGYGPYQGFGVEGLEMFDPRASILSRLKNELKYAILTQHYASQPLETPATTHHLNRLPVVVATMAIRLGAWVYRKRNPRVPALRGNARALDIGCGNGQYLLFLKRLGWDVEGFDIEDHTDPAVRTADIPVQTGSLRKLLSDGKTFSLITMWHVLEHLHDPLVDLKIIRDLLCPSGILWIEVPNSESLTARVFRSNWYQWDLPRHLNHFTTGSLVRLLRQAGFDLHSLDYRHEATFVNSLSLWLSKRRNLVGLKSIVRSPALGIAARVFDHIASWGKAGENIFVAASVPRSCGAL